jgi:putative MATE family efflux protein
MEKIFGQKWTFTKFSKFVFPSILTLIFIALYGMVDGIFISRYVGKEALAGLNMVLPVVSTSLALALMLSAGTNTIIAIKLGEKKEKEARELFTYSIFLTIITGFIMAVLTILFIDQILGLLGVNEKLYEYSKTYIMIYAIFFPIYVPKIFFEYATRTDGNAEYSLFLCVIGGVINIILDYLFIGVYGWGIAGAAWGTVLGLLFAFIAGFLYFLKPKILKLSKFKFNFKFIIESIYIGASNFVNQFSISIATLLFNNIALKYYGELGVAAISIIMYINFMVFSVMIGMSTGMQPVISYNFGSKNYDNIKRVINFAMIIGFTFAIISFLFTYFYNSLIINLFSKDDPALKNLVEHGFKFISFAYLFSGFNIINASTYAALKESLKSIIISINRSLVFIVMGLIIMTNLFEADGLWLTTAFAEFITFITSLLFMIKDVQNSKIFKNKQIIYSTKK